MQGNLENGQWFKDAIIYELHVKAFYDSNGDGVGDFQGLIEKLDYLEELGIDTIWLLPFYPSPLKDDGYDVSEYCDVHPDYGTLKQFKELLKQSKQRGIRVIVELAINHTSDQHPWFQRAVKAPKNSKYRDYYVWSDTPKKHSNVRVIFSDYESSNWAWSQEANAYYWHRFYKHQPDLNYNNLEVQMEVFKVVDFWLKMGVDGFRLSSVPFLFEKDNTTCENLPETHDFLKKLRKHVDKLFPGRILLAEANMWPEEAASYFGKGEECHMNFHYPLMPRMFMALHTEDSHPIIDILEQTPEAPNNAQWAIFLRNHDELMLDMVTEEEKDYLYRAYASDPGTKSNIGIRRRLAPMMNNDRRKIELMYTLLFSLPGTPIIYYGDEIGMGDNIYLGDRYGVRTPMQWNANSNAGFSIANPQKLFLPVITDPEYRYESVNVSNQENNPSSLHWWIKNAIGMRKRLKAFSRGSIAFIDSSNTKVMAFYRAYQEQTIIVVCNLSKHSQATWLDLKAFEKRRLTEVFSQNTFPEIESTPYPVTIGPFGYFWLAVERKEIAFQREDSTDLDLLQVEPSWEKLFNDYTELKRLENQILPSYLQKCRWFGGKEYGIAKVAINWHLPLKVDNDTAYLVVLQVDYINHMPELYFLPLSFVKTNSSVEDIPYDRQSIVCKADIKKKKGYLIDSIYNKNFRDYLFFAISKKIRYKYDEGELVFAPSVFSKIAASRFQIDSHLLKVDQNNTLVVYDDRYFFKCYRKIEKEPNPEYEIVKFLSEHTSFKNTPKFTGSIEYRAVDSEPVIFGLLEEKVEHQGDAWEMTLDALGRYFDRVLAKVDKKEKLPPLDQNLTLSFDDGASAFTRTHRQRILPAGDQTSRKNG